MTFHDTITKMLAPGSGFYTGDPSVKGTLTWVSILGTLLREAEKRYGPRDKSWTILGMSFGAPRPSLWFWSHPDKQLSVRLSVGAATNFSRAIRELGHEVIHLLDPSGRPETSVLEEGLAVVFAQHAMQMYDMNVADRGYDPAETDPNYHAAGELVRAVLGERPGLIKALRKHKPLHELRLTDLVAEGITSELAEKLVVPFEQSKGLRDEQVQ